MPNQHFYQSLLQRITTSNPLLNFIALSSSKSKTTGPSQFKHYPAWFFFSLLLSLKVYYIWRKSKRKKKKSTVLMHLTALSNIQVSLFFSASQCSKLSTCFNNSLDQIRFSFCYSEKLYNHRVGNKILKLLFQFRHYFETLFQNLDLFDIKPSLKKNLVSNVIVNTCSRTEM